MPAKEKSGEKRAVEPRKKGGRPRKGERETPRGRENLKVIVSPKTTREYLVSSRGEVLRVLANGRHQPVKPWFSGPYECVYIYGVKDVTNKYGRKKAYIHRLVAEHFLKKNGKKFVHHKNAHERDNNVSNLEFVTLEENLKAKKYFYKDEKGKVKRKKKGVKKQKDAAVDAG